MSAANYSLTSMLMFLFLLNPFNNSQDVVQQNNIISMYFSAALDLNFNIKMFEARIEKVNNFDTYQNLALLNEENTPVFFNELPEKQKETYVLFQHEAGYKTMKNISGFYAKLEKEFLLNYSNELERLSEVADDDPVKQSTITSLNRIKAMLEGDLPKLLELRKKQANMHEEYLKELIKKYTESEDESFVNQLTERLEKVKELHDKEALVSRNQE